MSDLRIDLADDRRSFKPGEPLTGRVSWRMDVDPKSAELRLFWFTRGKGTEDVGLIDTQVLTNPQRVDDRRFLWPLPSAPYSFSGKLIALVWAVELVLEPGHHVARCAFAMSPLGREIDLDRPRA